MRVILASASPRRTELLKLIGIKHEVMPANVDETMHLGEAPAVYADRVARSKAVAISTHDEKTVVIAADTIVVIDDDVLGKPRTVEEARAMLQRLAGRTHTVYTAIAVKRGDQLHSAVEHVAVTFRSLSATEIDAYIATREPIDKAGAYGIQGYGATIVERIDGDYFAVMGLSLVRTIRLLAAVGVTYSFGPL